MKEKLFNQLNFCRKLSRLSVMFVLMLLPLGMWAQNVEEYSLWICGVQVTSDNANNITSENITGTVSFDAKTNTLTLENATLTGSAITGGCILSQMSSLTISLEGNNTLECPNDTCTAIRGELSASQLNIVKGAEGCNLKIFSDYAIRDFYGLDITGLAWEGENTFGVIEFEYGYRYALIDMFGTEVGEAFLTDYCGLKVGGVPVTEDNIDNIFDEYFATATYDKTTHTLTLRANYCFESLYGFVEIGSEIEELNVYMLGYNEVGMNANYLFRADNNCTVNIMTDYSIPGKVVYYGNDVTNSNVTLNYANYGLVLRNGNDCSLIQAAEGLENILYFGKYQFYDAEDGSSPYADDGYPCWDYNGWYYSEAFATNEFASMPPTISAREGENGCVSYMRSTGSDIIKSLTFQGVPSDLELPIEVELMSLDGETTYATGTLVNGSVTLVPTSQVTYDDVCLAFVSELPFVLVPMAVKTEFTSYGIRVDGVEITEANAFDVFDDGTVSYSFKTNTLTLTNAYIGENDPFALECFLPSLTIDLVGNNTLYGVESFIKMRYRDETGLPASLTFASTGETSGSLTFVHSEGSIQDETYIFDDVMPTFTNGLALSRKGDNYIIGNFETYNLWIAGRQVTAYTKDNILNDESKSMRFDNTTNTLTMKDVDFTSESVYGDLQSLVVTSLSNLKIHFLGSNLIACFLDDPIFQNTSFTQADIPTLTFSTSAENPGKLTMLSENRDMVRNFAVEYENGLQMTTREGGFLISVERQGYGLFVYGEEVTNINADDVLGDNGSVTFDVATNTLSFNGSDDGIYDYEIDGDVVLAENSSIENLTVMLKHKTAITGIFRSEIVNNTPSLFFDTNPNIPGSLTFTGKTSAAEIQSGFNISSENLLHGLKQGAVNGGNDWQISTFIPITPIVNEEETETEEFFVSWDFGSDLSNVVVNNLLYTLPNGERFEPDDSWGYYGGIVISTGMTDEEVENAINADYPVGSDAYAEHFNGITLMVPQGEGEVTFKIKSTNGGRLKAKIGNQPAFEPVVESTVDEDGYSNVVIPFTCTEVTYIRVYLWDDGSSSGSTRRVPHRGKVLSGTVKVSSYSANCSMIITNNAVAIYNSVSRYGRLNSTNMTFTMSFVSITPIGTSPVVFARSTSQLDEGSAPAASSLRAEESDAVTYPIVELGPNAFDDMADKENLRYVDLANTQIKDMVVNRTNGVMKGFGEHTLVCLPEGNDDGGEPNIVVGGNCQKLVLDNSHDFIAPQGTFNVLNADFQSLVTAPGAVSLILPFAIPASQAENLGQFHLFNQIFDSRAMFYLPEDGDIPANIPCLFMPQTNSLQVQDVVVQGLDQTSVASGGSYNPGIVTFPLEHPAFIGTFKSVLYDTDQQDIYLFDLCGGTAVDDGKLIRAKAGNSIPPFSAYLQLPATGTQYDAIEIIIDDVANGTTDLVINNTQTTAPAVYNLQGQRVAKTAKGVYVVNGKKVLVQ